MPFHYAMPGLQMARPAIEIDVEIGNGNGKRILYSIRRLSTNFPVCPLDVQQLPAGSCLPSAVCRLTSAGCWLLSTVCCLPKMHKSCASQIRRPTGNGIIAPIKSRATTFASHTRHQNVLCHKMLAIRFLVASIWPTQSRPTSQPVSQSAGRLSKYFKSIQLQSLTA